MLLRNFQKNTLNKSLTSSFRESVKTIISILDKSTAEVIDDNDYFELIRKNTSNDFEANEIYIFLPISFTHLWLPNIAWHPDYIEINNGRETIIKYNSTESYNIIYSVSREYFSSSPSKNTIIRIGGRSAEINAINQLLMDGGNIEDIKVTRAYITK